MKTIRTIFLHIKAWNIAIITLLVMYNAMQSESLYFTFTGLLLVPVAIDLLKQAKKGGE